MSQPELASPTAANKPASAPSTDSARTGQSPLAGQTYAQQRAALSPGAPPAAAPDTGGIDAWRAPLIRGELKELGDYVDIGYSGFFTNSMLDSALTYYAAKFGVGLEGPMADAKPTEDVAKGGPKGGDSSAKDVVSFPKWFNVFQNRAIDAKKWDDDTAAVQAVLAAFLRKKEKQTPANVLEYFDHVGKSESNTKADDLTPSAKGAWCQGAATAALIRSLHHAGLFFIPKTATRDYPWFNVKKGGRITDQAILCGMFLEGGRTAEIGEGGSATQKMFGGASAWTAPLDPGDMISLVHTGPPLSGHVATIVGTSGDVIRMVSGNAGSHVSGSGSVRVEEVIRQTPPKEYNYDTESTKGNAEPSNMSLIKPGVNVPMKDPYIWVTRVSKTSRLDPSVLVNLSPDILRDKYSLQKK